MPDFVVVDDDPTDDENSDLLDLYFSTSQTFFPSDGLSSSLKSDVEFEIEQSILVQAKHCANHAPAIYYVDGAGRARLVEGCCNDWSCPRCGQIRARHEFTRIVSGANDISADHALYFWTFTCRGREMPLKEAETSYLLWTNRLLTAARAKAGRVTKKHPAPDFWCYSQVTERQTRMHPHSHVLTTYCPPDAELYKKGKTLPNGRKLTHDTLWSAWFRGEVQAVGLGSECEISPVISAISAAAYVSKYLFKSSMSTKWPKGWRRVRYSQNWPKLKRDKNPTAIPIIKHTDWLRVADFAPLVYCDSTYTYERALAHGVYNVLPPL